MLCDPQCVLHGGLNCLEALLAATIESRSSHRADCKAFPQALIDLARSMRGISRGRGEQCGSVPIARVDHMSITSIYDSDKGSVQGSMRKGHILLALVSTTSSSSSSTTTS